MTTHIINGKEWEERAFNHIGYSSVSHIFAMFPNEEALVLVRRKDDMKEEKPDYNSPEWEVYPQGKSGTCKRISWEVSEGEEAVVLIRRSKPTNPMPEIKPGDIIQIECGDTHGVWGFDVDDELNCFHFNSHEFSLISKSTVCKIRRLAG